MDRLTAMKVFAEVVSRGSFSAAAESLEMSRAMATRYVGELEQWLGTRLLQRSTRRISLTEAGEGCLQQCRRMLDLANELRDSTGARDSAPQGQLRVTASMSFGMAHLAPAMTEFLARYPGVTVDLLVVDRAVNLIEERIDLAVRIAAEVDPNPVARRIATWRSVGCAAPEYPARSGEPATPAELTGHNRLTYSNFGKGQWRFLPKGDGEEVSVPVGGNFSANEATVLTQAILSGAGIALHPTYLAGPLIQQGRLRALLSDWSPPELGIWGGYVSRRHVPAALRALLDFLVDRFGGVPYWDRD